MAQNMVRIYAFMQSRISVDTELKIQTVLTNIFWMSPKVSYQSGFTIN